MGDVHLTGTVSSQQAKAFFKPWMAYLDKKKDAPDEQAQPILKNFANMMYRGETLDQAFNTHLLKIFKRERSAGKGFWDAIVEPMALIISSPNFIYVRANPDLSNKQFANRISLLLWGSSADDKLYHQSQILRDSKDAMAGELERLLESDKADKFIHDFHYQWLELERYSQIAVSNKLHPTFNEDLRRELMKENFHFIKELVSSNEPIKKLIDADFIMANAIVAEHYGLKGIQTNEFQKVMLPEGSPFGGVLTSAAVMTLTTTGIRTSPVERGAFILRKFLDDPPLPAPANVPQLESSSAQGMTAKQVLAGHVSTAQCAACHRKMDNLGFALENFDTIGLPRDLEKRLNDKGEIQDIKIDNSGQFRGQTLNGVRDLKRYLTQNQDKLARTYIKALLSYSLGRELGFSDRAEIDALVKENAKNGYKMKNIILSLLNSKAFRKK